MDYREREELVRAVTHLVQALSVKEKESIFTESLDVIEKKIPLSIFTTELSGLESLVYYYKKVVGKSVKEIAILLKRKRSTIYSTYRKALQKLPQGFTDLDYSLTVSPQIFAQRKFSILEILVSHLHDQFNLSLPKIGVLLKKSYSTVRTVYLRYKKKCQK